ncbi:MAG: DUF1365 domain-containing protein [Pseudomonadota bacterium]
MSETPAIRLLRGHTVHQRSIPFTHRFKYGLTLVDVDIDRLEEAGKTSRFLSIDKPNLFSFSRKDHGAHDGSDLRAWAEDQFNQSDIDYGDGPIRLVTFPRHLFYKFAPISLWLSYDKDGPLRAILYEVNNTFGETHIYAAATPDAPRSKHATDKAFHVSPFFDVSGRYEFTLIDKDDRLNLIVATETPSGQQHMATIAAKRSPLTSGQLLKIALTKPFNTLAVTIAIHWQALKLVLKGARYHAKPKQSDTRISVAEQKGARPKREKAA